MLMVTVAVYLWIAKTSIWVFLCQHTCQASGASQAQMWRVFYCPDAGGEAVVKYAKPALSFEQQTDQLLQRGLQTDRTRLIETLSAWSAKRF